MHRDAIPVFASDHDTFYEAEEPLPAVWVANPGFSFYHTTQDTPETIDYRVLLGTSRFMARAITMVGNEDGSYEYIGSPPMDVGDATDALALLYAIRDSKVIRPSEQERLSYFVGELEAILEADDFSVLESPETFYWGALFFVMFELCGAHPGEIPPPFP